MDVASNIKHYKSKADFLNKNPSTVVGKSSKELIPKATGVEDKVQISKEALKAKDASAQASVKNDISHDLKEVSKAAGHVVGDAAQALGSAVSDLPIVPKLPIVSKPAPAKINKELIEKKIAPIHKPGIFLIEGLELLSSGGNDGLRQMREGLNGAEIFSWQDEDKVVEEILKRDKEQPIVLVGHSLGGDAIVNISNKLNNVKHGFRKIDLLVTLDSVGFDNDIIPQNVGKNLNFISDKDYFFNDGPNVARNSKTTSVENVLTALGHTAIDESSDVHFEILNNITKVLSPKKYQEKSTLEASGVDNA